MGPPAGEARLTGSREKIGDSERRVTPEQKREVQYHLWAVLATGRSDGSPQQSMVRHIVDAERRQVISARAYTASRTNAVRNQKVSVTVRMGGHIWSSAEQPRPSPATR